MGVTEKRSGGEEGTCVQWAAVYSKTSASVCGANSTKELALTWKGWALGGARANANVKSVGPVTAQCRSGAAHAHSATEERKRAPAKT